MTAATPTIEAPRGAIMRIPGDLRSDAKEVNATDDVLIDGSIRDGAALTAFLPPREARRATRGRRDGRAASRRPPMFPIPPRRP